MDLKLEARQTQVLSQHMIQSAKILQMTAQELNTYINDLALEMCIRDRCSGSPARCPASSRSAPGCRKT